MFFDENKNITHLWNVELFYLIYWLQTKLIVFNVFDAFGFCYAFAIIKYPKYIQDFGTYEAMTMAVTVATYVLPGIMVTHWGRVTHICVC